MPVTSFTTPAGEFDLHRHGTRPSASGTSPLLAGLVERHFAAQPFGSSLLHHPDRDFLQWQENASRTLRNCLLLPHTVGEPVETRFLHRDDSHPDYIVEELELSVTPPLTAPATAVIPRNATRRHPAIVALHSMGGHQLYGREKLLARDGENPVLSAYRQRYYDGRSLQAELARAGFLSIAIDAIGFGQRSDEATARPDFVEWRRGLSEEEISRLQSQHRPSADNRIARTLLALGYSTAALVASDDVRCVDYLLTRPDVDPQRIGCAGLSFGSFRANYLAALDPRVRAAVSVCWISTLAGVISHNIQGALGFFALPPGFYRHFDLADIPALAAPKPFLAISGWRDPMILPSAMADAHLFLRRVWERAGAPGNLGSLLFDTGHCFDATMQAHALAFLQRHLQPVTPDAGT